MSTIVFGKFVCKNRVNSELALAKVEATAAVLASRWEARAFKQATSNFNEWMVQAYRNAPGRVFSWVKRSTPSPTDMCLNDSTELGPKERLHQSGHT